MGQRLRMQSAETAVLESVPAAVESVAGTVPSTSPMMCLLMLFSKSNNLKKGDVPLRRPNINRPCPFRLKFSIPASTDKPAFATVALAATASHVVCAVWRAKIVRDAVREIKLLLYQR